MVDVSSAKSWSCINLLLLHMEKIHTDSAYHGFQMLKTLHDGCMKYSSYSSRVNKGMALQGPFIIIHCPPSLRGRFFRGTNCSLAPNSYWLSVGTGHQSIIWTSMLLSVQLNLAIHRSLASPSRTLHKRKKLWVNECDFQRLRNCSNQMQILSL